jgi:hypothetical protein
MAARVQLQKKTSGRESQGVVARRKNFELHAICPIRKLDVKPGILIRDKPILSSERMLHKDYGRKGSVAKKTSGRESQGACRQDELIGGKQPSVK